MISHMGSYAWLNSLTYSVYGYGMENIQMKQTFFSMLQLIKQVWLETLELGLTS